MANISELIELHIKALLKDSPYDYVELQRNELASQFKCVPSQINYVLSTRFTTDNGYVVESRRGGGGYIRIIKIPLDRHDNAAVQIYRLVGNDINQSQAEAIIKRLAEEEFITPREARIFRSAMDRNSLRLELPWRDNLRADLLKAMLAAVFRED
ncbi:CtsR family transcriptional regulator [Desulforamulus ruminis]|uniref:Transcriptional regulator CtsR n=1 Tax=Desulforamulus ruminis (strain ATCC 23193 / DSM 2154 / NCIMB 8452 / DL) TaxID=696281 RepID=F6DNL7_DESRL|nr:CtsR family transcriptional regulator [Desulforamulus ruminis]AEG58557.1 Firmicute transcriptional repressor of class III stress genes [Desulforamulus ruminis DSM 2154]